MSGKAELDKPFSVDCTRHLLKDFDAAGVVLDQVVVGTEDCGDFVLGGRGEWNFNINRVLLSSLLGTLSLFPVKLTDLLFDLR